MTIAALDLTLFHMIHDLAGKNIFLDAFGFAAAVYVIWIIALAALASSLVRMHGTTIAMRSFIAAAMAGLYNFAIGMFVQQARPPFVTATNSLITPMSSKSFPSDHAAISFAIAWSVYRVSPTVGKVLLVLAALVALGRVYVGVHFPSDIIVGAAAGIIIAEIVRQVDILWRMRKHPSRTL